MAKPIRVKRTRLSPGSWPEEESIREYGLFLLVCKQGGRRG
jgi:hypothetical protein